MLERCLDAVSALDPAPVRVFVVVDGRDRRVAESARDRDIEVLVLENAPGVSAARNAGAHAIAREREEALDEAEVADGVRDLERVLVEFVAVENAGEARDLEHGLIHHLGQQALDIGALREKPMAADVDAVVAPAVGARDAADMRRGFEDERTQAGLGKLERGGESGESGADHKVGCVVGEGIQSWTIIE